jgi:hypothetical protein
MRIALRRQTAAAAAAMWILMCPMAKAEGFLESIFRFMTHTAPPQTAPAGHAPVNKKRPSDAQSRNKQKIQIAHPSVGPRVISKDEKYLSSARFSQKFRLSPETGQKETQEAIGYLIEHDKTLRRGDALVTGTGVVIYDPKQGQSGRFVPVNDKSVAQPLQKRLVGFVEPVAQNAPKRNAAASQSGKAPAISVFAIKPEGAAERRIETSDGRTIRFVGGYLPEEGQSASSPENNLRLAAFRVRN